MEIVAVDTNVVVRFLVDDSPSEAKRARALFESHRIHIAESVLLETEWVLRAAYAFFPAEISTALRSLLRLPNVFVDDRAALLQVLDWFDKGLDFADALHYARSAGMDFKTFDKKFITKGRKHGLRISAP